MPSKSFYDVLEEQIRADLRKEIEASIEAEVRAQFRTGTAPPPQPMADRLETWLATHVNPAVFKASHATSKGYAARAQAKKSQPPPIASETRARALAPEQIFAFEFLNRHTGSKLPEFFSESELKTAWRRAAMKSHPDRYSKSDPLVQLQMAALFRELATCYERLTELFDSKSQAA